MARLVRDETNKSISECGCECVQAHTPPSPMIVVVMMPMATKSIKSNYRIPNQARADGLHITFAFILEYNWSDAAIKWSDNRHNYASSLIADESKFNLNQYCAIKSSKLGSRLLCLAAETKTIDDNVMREAPFRTPISVRGESHLISRIPLLSLHRASRLFNLELGLRQECNLCSFATSGCCCGNRRCHWQCKRIFFWK